MSSESQGNTHPLFSVNFFQKGVADSLWPSVQSLMALEPAQHLDHFAPEIVHNILSWCRQKWSIAEVHRLCAASRSLHLLGRSAPRKVFNVHVPRDYGSLQHAIESVPDESTLVLDAGTYESGVLVTVRKAVKIKGAGSEGDVVTDIEGRSVCG